MTHGPQSELDLAATRLKEFMDKHNASLDEMQKLLGVTKVNLQMILERRTIAKIYAGEIVLQLGSDMIDITTEKLNGLRGKTTPKKKPAEAASQQEAPTMPDAKYAPDSIQARAIQALADFQNRKDPKPSAAQMAADLDYSGGQKIHNIRSQFRLENLSEAAAQDLLDRIVKKRNEEADALQCCRGSESQEEINDTAHDGLDTEEPARACGSSDQENETQHDLSDADETQTTGEVKQEEPAAAERSEPEHVSSEASRYEEIHPELSKAWAQKYLLDEFGIDMNELQAIAPVIEHAIVARRNGTPCRLVIDSIEVRP